MNHHKIFRKICARVQHGSVKIRGRIYSDKRLRDWNGEQVEVCHDPLRPDSVWVVLGCGKGLMAARIGARGI